MSKNNMIIYRHPSMELSELNYHFLSVLLEKISSATSRFQCRPSKI